jgi:hypothetical protein
MTYIHRLPVDVSDTLPLLASVVWGTLQRDDGRYLAFPAEERVRTETDNSSVLQ